MKKKIEVIQDTFDCAEVNTDIKLMIHLDSETEALHA